MKYVQHIRNEWRLRITVPAELREIIGCRELVETNLPQDKRTRERVVLPMIARFLEQIDMARDASAAAKSAEAPTLSMAAKQHYAKTLSLDDKRRTNFPDAFQIKSEQERIRSLIDSGEITNDRPYQAINAMTDLKLMSMARDLYAKQRARRIKALQDSFGTGETRWITPDIAEFISNNKINLTPGSIEWKNLAKTLMRAEIEALKRTVERDSGNYSGVPNDPLLTTPEPDHEEPPSRAKKSTGPKLSEALITFHKERSAGGNTLAKKTIDEHKNAIRMFQEFMGGDVAVRDIVKQDVIAYKRMLLETPNRYTMRFPKLTLPEAVKANSRLSDPFATLAPQTINMKWLSHLSTVLQWSSNNGFIDSNPASGVRVETGSKTHKPPAYLAFTKDELQLIFGDPIFSSPSDFSLNQWALLVMLYTGVRNSSEMAKMKLSNIFEMQDIPVFYLEDASKNQRSKRFVPIHDDLVKIGFLRYVDKMRADKEIYLFPQWAKTTDKVNNWFNTTFCKKIGLTSSQKVFYSFRHTLATELAQVGVPRETSKMISGHIPQEVASIYIQSTPIKLMYHELNKASFNLPIKGLSCCAKAIS